MAQETIPPEYATDRYLSLLLEASSSAKHRLLIGVPMTGSVRAEWMLARYGQLIPCNWSSSDCVQFLNQVTPLRYSVADARNLIVDVALKNQFDWLFFIDSDVILPPDCFVKLNAYMREATIPVVNGLYFAKCHPPEPLIYRGRGNSYFANFRLGDKVWVDGISMGCTLIHTSVLQAMAAEAPEYVVNGTQRIKRVFDTPQILLLDPEHSGVRQLQGTEDLAWCDRVMAGNYLHQAGWGKIARRKHPFLADTSLFCWHITPEGVRYPLEFRW